MVGRLQQSTRRVRRVSSRRLQSRGCLMRGISSRLSHLRSALWASLESAFAALRVWWFNIGLGGTRAAGGTAAQDWTDTASAFPSVYKTRKLMLDLITTDPDLVMNFTGGNEIAQGVSVSTAIAGISTIRGWYPS